MLNLLIYFSYFVSFRLQILELQWVIFNITGRGRLIKQQGSLMGMSPASLLVNACHFILDTLNALINIFHIFKVMCVHCPIIYDNNVLHIYNRLVNQHVFSSLNFFALLHSTTHFTSAYVAKSMIGKRSLDS